MSLQLILDLLNLLLRLLNELNNKFAQDVDFALKLIPLGGSQTTLGQQPIQACKLLGSPGVGASKLVEDTDVVVSVGVLSRLLKLLSLLADLGGDLSDV